MKVRIIEYEGCYDLRFEAEDLKEAAALVRFKLNATKQIRTIHADAHTDTIRGGVVIGRRKQVENSI